MMRKITSVLAAFAFAAATLAPVSAAAQSRHGYYERHHGGHHGHRRGHRHHRDRGDAAAAGVVGLVLGLAIGSLAAQPREPRTRCYDNYQRCAPPPRYQDEYYEYEGGYDPRYDDRGYYSDDPYYDYDAPRRCVTRERVWDRYQRRYVLREVPC